MDLLILTDHQVTLALALGPAAVLNSYWKEQAGKDVGGNTDNPHIIAARILARGGPVTHSDINAVLARQDLSITAGELEELISLDYQSYDMNTLLDKNSAERIKFNALYKESVTKGQGKWGIYVYINNISNHYYVGSSTVLGERLRHYWKNHKAATLRKILQDIKQTGIANYTLRIYDFPVHMQEMRLLLALEQYYLLTLDPQNNTLYVAAGSLPLGRVVWQLLNIIVSWIVKSSICTKTMYYFMYLTLFDVEQTVLHLYSMQVIILSIIVLTTIHFFLVHSPYLDHLLSQRIIHLH